MLQTDKNQTIHSSTNYLKEMHFKAVKDKNSVTISGIVASKEAKERIIDAYGKAFQEVDSTALNIDENVKQDALLDFFINFADNFSHFDAGYLAYSNKSMEIDGAARHNITLQTLQEKIDRLKDIEVNNHLIVKSKTLPSDESIPQNLSDIEKKSHPTALEIQQSLDKVMKNRRVQFLYARDILTSESKKLIDEIITLLEKNSAIMIEISGHTDAVGTKKSNLRLSQRRAESVKRYMIAHKINSSRLKAIGYGESRPLVSNDTVKNRQINRRVEFKVRGE